MTWLAGWGSLVQPYLKNLSSWQHSSIVSEEKLKLNQFELKLLRSQLTLFHSLSQKDKRQTTYKKNCFRTIHDGWIQLQASCHKKYFFQVRLVRNILTGVWSTPSSQMVFSFLQRRCHPLTRCIKKKIADLPWYNVIFYLKRTEHKYWKRACLCLPLIKKCCQIDTFSSSYFRRWFFLTLF